MKVFNDTPETTVELIDGSIRITQPADGEFFDHDPVIIFDCRLAGFVINAINECVKQNAEGGENGAS